ncbi:MAG: HrpE/YscL family type III secretion apparatus protein [Geminicoccaceae bacterium]
MSVLRLKSDAMTISPDQRIISADDYHVWLAANECLTAAREQAASITDTAEAAYQEERRQGYEDGKNEAKAELAGEAYELVMRRIDYIAKLEAELIDLVADTAAAIIGKVDHEDMMTGLVRTGLERLKRGSSVTIRVESGLARYLRQQIDLLARDYPAVAAIEISGEPSLGSGQCLLDTEMGTIDASVDVQLSALRQALKRVFVET